MSLIRILNIQFVRTVDMQLRSQSFTCQEKSMLIIFDIHVVYEALVMSKNTVSLCFF